MTINSLANVILCHCEDVSNKKLQKLSYYVYSWYITIYNREIAEMSFEAWKHGPVCRRLYNKYRNYGWKIIPSYEGLLLAKEEDIKFIDVIIDIYGKYSADELEEMTHKESPWIAARANINDKDNSNI